MDGEINSRKDAKPKSGVRRVCGVRRVYVCERIYKLQGVRGERGPTVPESAFSWSRRIIKLAGQETLLVRPVVALGAGKRLFARVRPNVRH